jgi:hypothetical protein
MNAEHTLTALKQFCLANSGDEQMWENKGTTYHWNRGKVTATGMVNGVVRKLAGIDSSGQQIWTVAGSIKIDANGTILRFTGMPKKQQKLFEGVGNITATAKDKVLQPV